MNANARPLRDLLGPQRQRLGALAGIDLDEKVSTVSHQMLTGRLAENIALPCRVLSLESSLHQDSAYRDTKRAQHQGGLSDRPAMLHQPDHDGLLLRIEDRWTPNRQRGATDRPYISRLEILR